MSTARVLTRPRTLAGTSVSSPILRRSCACGARTTASDVCAECRHTPSVLQRTPGPRRARGRDEAHVPAVVHDVVRSTGEPLDSIARGLMESRFGYDFTGVRVHTDARAATAAAAIDARAFTVGQHVVFAAQQYQPHSPVGLKLLAHELAHTIQQSGSGTPSASEIILGPSDLSHEYEAAAVAERVDVVPSRAVVAPGIQRKTWDDLPVYEERPDVAHPEPSDEKTKKAPQCSRTIFAEGTCAHLVAKSKYICCDPANGLTRKGRTTDIDDKPCPSEKFTSIFTCDNTCDKALAKGCSDDDNWMAVPNNQFTRKQCGDIWTICANGKQTTGYVRDHSVTQSRFEVSPKIQKDLGVSVGSSFKGSIYRPGADAATIAKDSCCNA